MCGFAMDGTPLVIGLLVSVQGLLMSWKPYRVARFGERIDAIGSKRRWTKVEPSDWNVTLTRRLGPFAIIFGLFLIYLSLHAPQ